MTRLPPPRTPAAKAALELALRNPANRRAWLAELADEADRRIRNGTAHPRNVEQLATSAIKARQVLADVVTEELP